MRKQKQSSGCAVVFLGLFCLFGIFGVITMALDDGTRQPRQKPPATSGPMVRVGETGRLDVGGGEVLICRTVDAYNRMQKYAAAKDEAGFYDLMREGLAFAVDDGTRVKMIDTGLFRCEVRIAEGPMIGERGYTVPEFVVR